MAEYSAAFKARVLMTTLVDAAVASGAPRAAACAPAGIVQHADNWGPMKGATMLATLKRLGVLASFSRPGVSNDNPFSEALFRTLEYCPGYPLQPFADADHASAWVAAFVQWYNHEHQHSAIRVRDASAAPPTRGRRASRAAPCGLHGGAPPTPQTMEWPYAGLVADHDGAIESGAHPSEHRSGHVK